MTWRSISDGPCVVGVTCTFVDANHCPGAVMIVFDNIPGRGGLQTVRAGLLTWSAWSVLKPSIAYISEGV
jgi:hypothetical protein